MRVPAAGPPPGVDVMQQASSSTERSGRHEIVSRWRILMSMLSGRVGAGHPIVPLQSHNPQLHR